MATGRPPGDRNPLRDGEGIDVIAFHNRLEVYTPVERVARLEEPMATMRAVQVSRPGGPFEMVERPIPEPGAGSVRIKVRACGICHSDALTKEGGWPGMQHPRVPGHEVAGAIDADRKSTRLNSSHRTISYAVFCLKKKTRDVGKYNAL